MSGAPGADDEQIGLRARSGKHPGRLTPLNAAADRHYQTVREEFPDEVPEHGTRLGVRALAGVLGNGAHNF
jgi:hypothetical protein